MLPKNLESDLSEALNAFPKLKLQPLTAGVLTLEGDLDIVDTVGEYWDTFIIKIVVPIHSYPSCIPTVYEVSSKIKRTDDYHISIEGECCLDITHRLIHIKQQGISLLDFITNIMYPYFANQAYKIYEKKYAGEEWKHGLLGIVQYYKDEHNITGSNMIYSVLGLILKEDPKLFKPKFINKQCFCGSGKKYKGCHYKSIRHIKSLGAEIILNDRGKLFTYINKHNGNPPF